MVLCCKSNHRHRIDKYLLDTLLMGGSVAEVSMLDSGAEGPGSNRSRDAVG